MQKSSSKPDNITFEYIFKGGGCSIVAQGHVLNYIHSSIFVIFRTWTQPKCPAIEKELKKVWYIYTMEYYTAEKKMKY